ncbi:hypothetical protein BC826DRAFT_1101354 [Russula brevipes]|nr:hypothetical protein BC826DRAFT_1101354 [Russula brevipes]
MGGSGSRKKKDASENHLLKQRTLFDHFLVMRNPTPAPVLAKPDDPRDDEPESQTVVEQTDTECRPCAPDLLELSSAGHGKDIIYTSSLHGSSTQSTADGYSQETCSVDQGPASPLSSYEVSSAADSSPADVGLVAGSDFPESGPCSSVPSPASSLRISSHIIDLTMEEGTEKAPILIEGSPICELPSLPPTPPSDIPFQHMPLGKWKQQKDNSLNAPFPDASTQHVRHSVMNVRAPPISFLRRGPRTSQSSLDPPPSLPIDEALSVAQVSDETARSHRRIRSSEHQADANAVLSCHGNLHPAITTVLGLASEPQGTKDAPQQHWSQKWRPRRAEQVLGNENNACYLREWMHALRLHFDTGPSSTRSTPRPGITKSESKAGDLDGWIVNDDDDDGDDGDDLNEEYSGSEDFNWSYLFMGPPRAAAYFLWKENSQYDSFAKKGAKNTIETVDEPPVTGIHPQSVVLIEEADVVFADEAGFWPSVVGFIRGCRRPVIITCNDVSLIPVETLPLQTTLTFSLPPMSLLGRS